MKKIALVIQLLTISILVQANVKLPKLVGDNMVLQRDKPVNIWGWADPGEKVTVQFNKQSKSIKTDKTGKWIITLASEKAGGPYSLTIKGKNTITLNNILVGEVWVCSGQSNMEWPVRSVRNAKEEIQSANYSMIRHFTVQKSVSGKTEDEVKGGEWQITSPETVGNFTAVGYFFARDVYEETKIPIGLIHTSWGGTHSETWTSREAFEGSDEFKGMISKMPNLNLEELSKKKNETMKIKLAEMRIQPNTDVTKWKESDFNDSSWPTISVPHLWEGKFGDLDGVAWYRKTIKLEISDLEEATLDLAMIDDSDETYINGIKIGSTNAYNVARHYKVEPTVLKAGVNTIAVRVVDTGGGGGIYGDKTDVKLTMKSGKIISLSGEWKFNLESINSSLGIGPNSYPTLLFNAMLNPILNYSIRGALWYQGESNAGRAYQYRKAFPLMIQDWRNHFKQGDFPFYFVQLASFNANNGNSNNGSGWAELREAQTMALSLPNTGMAVATDIGESKDIHPRNKQDVGKRLAAIALNRIYDLKRVDSGPTYESIKIEGNKIRVKFSSIGSGLLAKDKYGYLKGFEIAGEDQKFYYAQAQIESNEVIVSCDQVNKPVAVRFSWSDDPNDSNLFNKEGFPAVPFRTDNWKCVTQESKFSFQ